MKNKQIIFYELNEVPEKIFKDYRKKSKNFNKILAQFSIYKTKSLDECTLSPWITWSTVHRGVNYESHKIKNLGQDVSLQNKNYPPIWVDLKNKGLKVGVYGSLHLNQLPKDFTEYSFYVPDSFSDHFICYPKHIEPIQDFQLQLTRSSSRNVDKSFIKQISFRLIRAFLKSGITLNTYLKLAKQLIHERIDNSKTCRRRTCLSLINFDIYFSLLKSQAPNFSSFYSNHVASSMHRFWEAAYPEDYKGKNKQNKNWIKTYENEIDFSMSLVENHLNKLLKYAKEHGNCEVWVCTSMGQAAVVDYEPVRSQIYISDTNKLLEFIGLNPKNYEIMPAMFPRWTFKGSKNEILKLTNSLNSLLIDDSPIETMSDEFTVTVKIECFNKIPIIKYNENIIDFKEIGFESLKIKDGSGSSAYHIPEGMLLIFGKNSERFQPNEVITTNKIKSMIVSTF